MRGPEIALLAGETVEFQESHQIGHHFVGFGVRSLEHRPGAEQRRDEFRAIGLLPGLVDYETGKLQIARIAGVAVKLANGLQYTGRSHADVR